MDPGNPSSSPEVRVPAPSLSGAAEGGTGRRPHARPDCCPKTDRAFQLQMLTPLGQSSLPRIIACVCQSWVLPFTRRWKVPVIVVAPSVGQPSGSPGHGGTFSSSDRTGWS